MQKILILQGLPGSGKSTYAEELMLNEKGKWKRVNKDLLREMLDFSVFNNKNEKLIVNTRDWLIEYFIHNNFSVIVDDTNLHSKHVKRIIEIANQNDVEVKIMFIDTPLYECIERDSLRSKPVGEKVIRDMYNNFLLPKYKRILERLDI